MVEITLNRNIRKIRGNGASGSKIHEDDLADEELLSLYLRLPKRKREKVFTSTASAARMVGISQRTIELWTEAGVIRAVHIGRNLQIYFPSLKGHLISSGRHNR